MQGLLQYKTAYLALLGESIPAAFLIRRKVALIQAGSIALASGLASFLNPGPISMMNRIRTLFVHCLLGLFLIGCVLPARAASSQSNRKLTFVLILTRHGIRAPGATPQRLDRYSVDPWPQWPVRPDYLTDHGYKVLQRFGAWDRNWLRGAGLLSGSGCDTSDIYIYTDSDQRTIRSGEALAEGLGPSCKIGIHSLPQGTHDPLFHFSASSLDATTRPQVMAEIQKSLPGGLHAFTASYQHQLDLLQSVLDGCRAGTICSSKKQPQIRLMDIPDSIKSARSHDVVSIKGPVFTAASLAEDLLLEYTQGLPRQEVAWGRVDGTQLREIINLHTAEFSLRHRTPALARIQMSNLFDHILLTLQQSVEGHAVNGAFGPAGKKLVVIDGHDTDIAAIAGLLHLHWILDGRRDDTPPGTQLQFLVFRDRQGRASVQLRIAMQTLEQMRYAKHLSKINPPASVTLKPQSCTLEANACSWKQFAKIATGAIDPRYIVPLKQ